MMALGSDSDADTSPVGVFSRIDTDSSMSTSTLDEESPCHSSDGLGPLTPATRRPTAFLRNSIRVAQPPRTPRKTVPPRSSVATTVESGAPGTLEYSLSFFDSNGCELSPLHHIQLLSGGGLLTVVCKTPRDTWQEFECAPDSEGDHLPGDPGVSGRQSGGEGVTGRAAGRRASSWDGEYGGIRKGCGKGPLKLREEFRRPYHYAENAFWNVGMLPQTWGDPGLPNHNYGGLPYDGRPLELIDIAATTATTGEVYAVKPLAAFATIDFDRATLQPELAWKVIGIRADDLSAVALDDAADIYRRMPGVLEEIREWLRICHCVGPDDQPCLFGLNERAAGREEALRAVAEAHASWQGLVQDRPYLTDRSPPSKFAKVLLASTAKEVAGSKQGEAGQGQTWARVNGNGDVGEQLQWSEPCRWVKSKFDRGWGEGVVLDGTHGTDSESNWSGSQSLNGSSSNGSYSRRQGLKTIRSAPLFSRPAYIEPREGEGAANEEEKDWVDMEFKSSHLCFALNAKVGGMLPNVAAAVASRKSKPPLESKGGDGVASKRTQQERNGALNSSWEARVQRTLQRLKG